MATRTSVSAATAVDTAWALFCQFHDVPSHVHAERLVHWLGEDPRHMRAFDDALTLWALAGAGLVKPALEEARCRGSDLQ